MSDGDRVAAAAMLGVGVSDLKKRLSALELAGA